MLHQQVIVFVSYCFNISFSLSQWQENHIQWKEGFGPSRRTYCYCTLICYMLLVFYFCFWEMWWSKIMWNFDFSYWVAYVLDSFNAMFFSSLLVGFVTFCLNSLEFLDFKFPLPTYWLKAPSYSHLQPAICI